MRRAVHTHVCFAAGCFAPMHESALMCPKHLEMIPQSIRLRLESSWEAGGPLIDQGQAYCEAAAEAIELVADLEYKPRKNLFRARAELLGSRTRGGPVTTAADLPAAGGGAA